MTDRKAVVRDLEDMPEGLLSEVHDFIRFLKRRAGRPKRETALLSEPALGKDWLRPEEDEAWQDL